MASKKYGVDSRSRKKHIGREVPSFWKYHRRAEKKLTRDAEYGIIGTRK